MKYCPTCDAYHDYIGASCLSYPVSNPVGGRTVAWDAQQEVNDLKKRVSELEAQLKRLGK
jgi:hypothetical protein